MNFCVRGKIYKYEMKEVKFTYSHCNLTFKLEALVCS